MGYCLEQAVACVGDRVCICFVVHLKFWLGSYEGLIH